MDELDDAAQSWCPVCAIVMRDGDGGGAFCPSCGMVELSSGERVPPPRFDGPAIHGG